MSNGTVLTATRRHPEERNKKGDTLTISSSVKYAYKDHKMLQKYITYTFIDQYGASDQKAPK